LLKYLFLVFQEEESDEDFRVEDAEVDDEDYKYELVPEVEEMEEKTKPKVTLFFSSFSYYDKQSTARTRSRTRARGTRSAPQNRRRQTRESLAFNRSSTIHRSPVINISPFLN
jgi:arginine utilization protein RocB